MNRPAWANAPAALRNAQNQRTRPPLARYSSSPASTCARARSASASANGRYDRHHPLLLRGQCGTVRPRPDETVEWDDGRLARACFRGEGSSGGAPLSSTRESLPARRSALSARRSQLRPTNDESLRVSESRQAGALRLPARLRPRCLPRPSPAVGGGPGTRPSTSCSAGGATATSPLTGAGRAAPRLLRKRGAVAVAARAPLHALGGKRPNSSALIWFIVSPLLHWFGSRSPRARGRTPRPPPTAESRAPVDRRRRSP
jgi:hypothetical protein